MPTPLQDRAYELLIRASSIPIASDDFRVKSVCERMFSDAVNLGQALEAAMAAPDRSTFQRYLRVGLTCVRTIKLWVRVLDDLGSIMPEAGAPLLDVAEEVHRLLLAAMRTAKANGAEVH
jgi:hypothetical protein